MVVTTVTREGAEARGAAGCDALTDDVVPLFHPSWRLASIEATFTQSLFPSQGADLKSVTRVTVVLFVGFCTKT